MAASYWGILRVVQGEDAPQVARAEDAERFALLVVGGASAPDGLTDEDDMGAAAGPGDAHWWALPRLAGEGRAGVARYPRLKRTIPRLYSRL